MQSRGSSSSLHYDPYHNLLCVVRGCKTVHTFPPTATPWLYSQQLWSESANHSQVSLPQPDLAKQPLFARALPMRETFTVEVCTLRALHMCRVHIA